MAVGDRVRKPDNGSEGLERAAGVAPQLKPVSRGGGSLAAASPARQLQNNLHKHFSPEIAPIWTRYVTLFVALTLIGGWLGSSGAYTVLQS